MTRREARFPLPSAQNALKNPCAKQRSTGPKKSTGKSRDIGE